MFEKSGRHVIINDSHKQLNKYYITTESGPHEGHSSTYPLSDSDNLARVMTSVRAKKRSVYKTVKWNTRQ